MKTAEDGFDCYSCYEESSSLCWPQMHKSYCNCGFG